MNLKAIVFSWQLFFVAESLGNNKNGKKELGVIPLGKGKDFGHLIYF
ncbi:MAG: hypothetical protein IPL83_04935 [Bdellovibrionales bacterium]|nr:hypothetical protein [Bdellovibrionales bacterium]